MNLFKRYWGVIVYWVLITIIFLSFILLVMLKLRNDQKSKEEITEPVKEESINSVSLKCTYCNKGIKNTVTVIRGLKDVWICDDCLIESFDLVLGRLE